MFDFLKEKAKSLKESTAQNTGEFLMKNALKGQDLFGEHYQKIEPIIVNGLLGIAEEKLKDEAFLEGQLQKVYEILPMPIRVLMPREKFLEMAIKQKAPLLQKVAEIKDKRNETPLLAQGGAATRQEG